jgi:ornithine carbamoyltransferase
MHLISIADLTHKDIVDILNKADYLKAKRRQGIVTDLLRNKSLAMIFEKSSTRTRVSFEVGMTDLGGHAIYLDPSSMQMGRGEPIEDTAKILSSYVHGIMIRAKKHETVTEFAKYSKVPVINGLTDHEHPCQILADLMTIREKKNGLKGVNCVWVGDGNNVCNSLILGAALTGMRMIVACPEGYEPDKDVLEKAKKLDGDITIGHDLKKAVKEADVLYTDVWVSMGWESEREQRLKDLKDYQINTALIKKARKGCIVMHCLPANRGEEITDEAMKSPNSVIIEQAENRLHSQKALMVKLMGKAPEKD